MTLAKALQRCAVHSGLPLGVLCRAVWEIPECLIPIVERGDQFNLQMLDIAEGDPKVPTLAERTLSLTSEPVEATPSEELALDPRQRPALPLGFSLSWTKEADLPP